MSPKNNRTLAIVGQGYVGLPLAMSAVDNGWTVIGIDNSEAKVSQINAGSSPVEDIEDRQLRAAVTNGAYYASTDFRLVSQASIITICVPTPLDKDRTPDLNLLRDAVKGIAPFISSESLVVNESTSYPGTLRNIIIPIVNEFKSKETKNLYFASSPERVNPGDFVWNLKNTPRLLGSIDTSSMAKGLEFYKTICEMVIPVSSPEVAEAAKLLENTFRLVNIALVNEFAQICSVNNLDINEVIDAATSKPYGYMSFRPGVGVGGHCIPVDPLYLTWWAKQNGIQPVFVEAADSINRQMPKFIANRALSLITNKTNSPRVLILGVAYKPGVSDVRETPVAALRDQLLAKGAEVAWYDPLVSKWEDSSPVNLEWDCDVAILATMQPGMNLKSLINRGTKILDCTNTLDKSQNIIGI